MASKKNFLDTLIRLSYAANDAITFDAVAGQAAAQWTELKAEQRADLVHDDARCRIFAAGHAAGYAAGQSDAQAARAAARWVNGAAAGGPGTAAGGPGTAAGGPGTAAGGDASHE